MAASGRCATVSEDDFELKCFFFLFFEIITCVFILKAWGEFVGSLLCTERLRLRLSDQ